VRSLIQEKSDHLISFFDDVFTTKSNTEAEALQKADTLLTVIAESGFLIAAEKLQLGSQLLRALGHVIVGDRYTADPSRLTNSLNRLKIPSTRQELQSVLGIFSSVRDFIPDYTAKARLLEDLLTKERNVKRDWTPEHTAAVTTLARCMANPRVLVHPDYTKPSVVITDACDTSFAGYLFQIQTSHPCLIALYAGKFTGASRNYSIALKECLALVKSIAHFRKFINATLPLLALTDNIAVSFLRTLKHDSSKLYRWSLLLSEFDLLIKHIPGKSNPADAPSRASFLTDSDFHSSPRLNAPSGDEDLTHDEAWNLGLHQTIAAPRIAAITRRRAALEASKGRPPLADPQPQHTPEQLQPSHTTSMPTPARLPPRLSAESQTERMSNAVTVALDPMFDLSSPRETLVLLNTVLDDTFSLTTTDPHLPAQEQPLPSQEHHTLTTQDQPLPERMQHYVRQEQKSDPFCVTMRAFLQSGAAPADWTPSQFAEAATYQLSTSQVLMKGVKSFRKWKFVFYLPQSCRLTFMMRAHTQVGHAGAAKTCAHLAHCAFWPHMLRDVSLFIRACDLCAYRKRKYEQDALRGGITSTGFNHIVCIDHKIVNASQTKNKAILVTLELFSGYVVLCPVENLTAETFIASFTSSYIAYFGAPRHVHSDNHGAFTAAMTQQFFERIGSTHSTITASNPQANPVERENSNLKTILDHLIDCDPQTWDLNLGGLMLALNLRERNHGYSPLMAVTGSANFDLDADELDTAPMASIIPVRLKALQHIRESLKDFHVAKNEQRLLQYTQQGLREFSVGEQVLYCQHRVETANKHKPAWTGPYTVSRVHKDELGVVTSYSIFLNQKPEEGLTTIARRLKRYYTAASTSSRPQTSAGVQASSHPVDTLHLPHQQPAPQTTPLEQPPLPPQEQPNTFLFTTNPLETSRS